MPGQTAQRGSIFQCKIATLGYVSVALDKEHMKEKQPTLLTLCIVDTQPKQRWPLAPQQSDITGGQVQLEDRRIHVLGPKDEITIMRDSEWMVQLLSIVHHLQHEANTEV